MEKVTDRISKLNIKVKISCLICKKKILNNKSYGLKCYNNYMTFMNKRKCIKCNNIFMINDMDDKTCLKCK